MGLITDTHAVGVGAIIVNDEGKILLIKRKGSTEAGKWAVAGGHVNLKEKLHDALIREVKEETNLEVSEVQFFTFKEVIRHDVNAHYLVFYYIMRPASKDIICCEKEVEEYGWFDRDEISDLDLAFSNMKLFEKFFETGGSMSPGFIVETDGRW